jgi:PKD repeat protein
LTFELRVTDNEGATARRADPVNVTVNNMVVPNREPTDDAGDDQMVIEGDSVNLNASGSSDPDDDALTYAWTQTAGTAVTLSDPNSASPSFTAPDVGSSGETLTFELTADDRNGHMAAGTVNVNVLNVNQPPIAEISSPPEPLQSGAFLTFSAEKSNDPDGEIVDYEWDFGDGITGKGINATHTYNAPGQYNVKLEVIDDKGAKSQDSEFPVDIRSISTIPNGVGTFVSEPSFLFIIIALVIAAAVAIIVVILLIRRRRMISRTDVDDEGTRVY